MTLVELLVGTLLLVGGGGALLLGMQYAMAHVDYLSSYQTAMNAVQGQLEQLSPTDFSTLQADAAFNGIRNGALERFDINGDGDTTDPVDGQLAIQIRPVPLGNPSPTVLELHVAACWQQRGRLIGERAGGACADGGGAGWWVESPAMVSTRVAMP